jgi:hypothetical protein
VEVTDETGNRVGGVPVTVTHVPTGRVISVTANDSGIATLRGLAVGGPYEISIPPGANYAAERVTDIILKLDDARRNRRDSRDGRGGAARRRRP